MAGCEKGRGRTVVHAGAVQGAGGQSLTSANQDPHSALAPSFPALVLFISEICCLWHLPQESRNGMGDKIRRLYSRPALPSSCLQCPPLLSFLPPVYFQHDSGEHRFHRTFSMVPCTYSCQNDSLNQQVQAIKKKKIASLPGIY